MKRNNKKGFTIVELVIVIAVIAILAAVLIPTFASLVNKANQSADQQAVRQMNTALTMYAAENGKPTNVVEAKKALDEALVNVEGGLVPVTQGYAFYWDSTENVVVLVASGDAVEADWAILTANAYGEQISVSNSNELDTALDKASNGPVSITLTSDVTFDVAGTSSGKTAGAYSGTNHLGSVAWEAKHIVGEGEVVEIDLNGNTLTFTGSDTAELGFYVDGGTLTIKNGTINSSGFQQVIANNKSTLVLTDVVINDTSEQCVIQVAGISDTAITGCEITTTAWQGIGTNSNNASTDGVRISIIDTNITAENAAYPTTAVLLNIIADVTIDGCMFQGEQHGMLLRGNNAVVKNSTFIYDLNEAATYETYGAGGRVPAGAIVLHAGGGYGGDATFTYTFENVTADVVNAGTTGNAKLIISGIEVNEMLPAVSGAITVK